MIAASLENDVFPKLGEPAIDGVQPGEIRALVQSIEARGAGETATRVFQRLRANFRYAIAHELLETDSTHPLKPSEIFRPRKTTHRAALSERDVPAFLHKLASHGGDPMTQAALALLMMTATRPGELRGARWDEFNERAATWRIPASRMKMKTEHTVPLSKQALALLAQMRRVSGDGASVFPSPFYPDKPLSDGTLNSALARLGYKGMVTAHGFRTLFSTCANEAGWNSDAIETQLAHEERDEVRGAYKRGAMDDRAREADAMVVGSARRIARRGAVSRCRRGIVVTPSRHFDLAISGPRSPPQIAIDASQHQLGFRPRRLRTRRRTFAHSL